MSTYASSLARIALAPALALVACGGDIGVGPGGDVDAATANRDDMAVVLPDIAVPIDLAGADLTGTVPDDGGDVPDGLACIANLESIALSPATNVVTIDGKTAFPMSFSVTGTLKNGGGTTPIDSKLLAWNVTRPDDTPPGTIQEGVLTPFAQAGGTVTITATDGCVTGTATVEFKLKVDVGDPPQNPGDWAAAPVMMAPPTVVYPSDQTRFPRNIYRTLFQWRTAGYSRFRLTFAGPNSTVTVYTDGAHAQCANKNPAAGCWEADETDWQFIAGSNAGEVVTFTLDALDTATMPPTVRRATPIQIGFSKRDVKGAIFYWSTTSAGIRRAAVGDAQPEDYITGKPGTVYPPDNQIGCVACHTVSRDGKYMVAPVQADSGKSLWIMEVTKTAPPNPLVTQVPNTGGHGFATISPDNSKVVAAFKPPMVMLDRATGAAMGTLPTGQLLGTQPDWSPDDTQLVFATGQGDSPGGASIAVIPWSNGTWGMPKVIVPASGASNLFPMFNPDGKFIAYGRGQGGHGDDTMQLWVTDSAAAKAPVELIAANRVVSNQSTDGQHQNAQPTWAPSGDFEWVAFNSVREYGVVQKAGTQQIWVAAVDKARLAQGGVDPSYPAFHLQFQGLTENNHRAFWTLDVRDPDPIPDGGVPPDMTMVDLAITPRDMAGDLARACIPLGNLCDPVLDRCCDSNAFCDTMDNGETYRCIPGIN